MSRHRRWGRDSLTGGRQHSWLAAVGGFLVAPAAMGLASGFACQAAGATTPQKVATIYAGGHLAGLVGAWWGAKKFPAAHSFLRGAMWGEGVVATLATMSAASVVNLPVQAPGGPVTTNALAQGSSSQAQLKQLAARLVDAGWIKK